MFHIILNPVAGKKKALKNLAALEEVFKKRNIAYEAHKTCAVHDGEAIARRLTLAGEQDIIVVGGDGTLHEVLNGVVDPANCRLGLIPSGTGNDFAARLGLPLDAKKAATLILDSEAKAIDYLEVGGVRCMNVAGVGMDVDVLERCRRGKMKGKLKYLVSLLKSLFAFKGLPVIVESEGIQERHEALLAAACNGSQFGGGVRICPVAEADDGKINVVIVECLGSKMKIIKAFLKLMRGKILQYPATKHFLCERVRFTPEVVCPMQLDGELYREIPFDVRLGKGLKFYR